MNSKTTNKMETCKWILFGIILGFFIFIFFTVVHPLYIYDTDDWTYITYSRHAWPSTKLWNPTKILPETLMPLAATIGYEIIMPLTKDYISSMALSFALVLTMLIVTYSLMFGNIIRKIFSLKTNTIILIILLFLLYHFLPYNVNDSGNRHLFHGGSVNNTFNYLIPALFNMIFVMYLILNTETEKRKFKKNIENGVIVLISYLCINSNLFHSIILASFAGTHILFSLIKKIRHYNSKVFLKEMFLENLFWLYILILWFGSLLFEIQGGRAQVASQSLLKLPVIETLHIFVQSIKAIHKWYLYSMVIITIVGLSIYFFTKKNEYKDVDHNYILWMKKFSFCFFITWIYLILLCAKVTPYYISSNLVEYSWMFWIMLIGFISFAYTISKFSSINLLLPLFVYIIVFETIISGKSYAEINTSGFSKEIVKCLDQNIINQVIAADEAGLSDVIVHIPEYTSPDWPINMSYGNSRIAVSLYRSGIVSKLMNITFVMDPSINTLYNVPL